MPGMTRESFSFRTEHAAFRERFDPVLEALLPVPDAPEGRVVEAMRHATLGGGKRLRPFVLSEAARMFGVDEESRLRAGAAVELLHAYSLVHDDLPVMDDDDLRRGRPTCHVAFDEATALLAGDALQALAFEVLASPRTHPDAAARCALVHGLARAAGSGGMVGGQTIDMLQGRATALGVRFRLARMKTGALLAFAAEAGAVLGRAGTTARRDLRQFGSCLGLLFQIVDDLLDEEGAEARVGKRLRKDAEAGKPTLVSVLGAEGARNEARRAYEDALGALETFGPEADGLRATATFVLHRDR